MIQALKNRIRIFGLNSTLSSKAKLLFWSCALPLLNKGNLPMPSFKVIINGADLNVADGTDLGTFFEIFLHEEYKISGTNIPIKRILDLGANSGYTSVYFAGLYKDAQIIAIEADLDNVEKTKKNIASFGERIKVENVAISSENGHVDFYRNFNASISGSTILRDDKAQKMSVPATTLAELEKKYGGFDIIKFDIEGGEWDSLYPEMTSSQPQIWIGEYHEDLTKRPVSDFIGRFKQYDALSQQIARKRYLLTFNKKLF